MDNPKYIGMDVHKEAIAIAVLNAAGKLVMESIIETKANTILEFLKGLPGELHLTFCDDCPWQPQWQPRCVPCPSFWMVGNPKMNLRRALTTQSERRLSI